VHTIDHESLIQLFECNHSLICDTAESLDSDDFHTLEEDFKKQIGFDKLIKHKKAVLGIDIYQYSQYEESKQIVIPFVFQQLLLRTFKVCLATEPFLFQKYKNETFEKSLASFLDTFIDTGDGGFLVFDTPLHAVIFALYFEAILRNFNSRFIYMKLNSFVDSILLRYTITYDTIYRIATENITYFNNFYGSAIINCARIISKDRLNRCLIDAETNRWFLHNTNGVETLTCLPYDQLAKSKDFSDYSFSMEGDAIGSYCLPLERTVEQRGIHRVDVQKIGEIQAKTQVLSIFNLQMQFSYRLPFAGAEKRMDTNYFTATLGNLNTQGIL